MFSFRGWSLLCRVPSVGRNNFCLFPFSDLPALQFLEYFVGRFLYFFGMRHFDLRRARVSIATWELRKRGCWYGATCAFVVHLKIDSIDRTFKIDGYRRRRFFFHHSFTSQFKHFVRACVLWYQRYVLNEHFERKTKQKKRKNYIEYRSIINKWSHASRECRTHSTCLLLRRLQTRKK